jgi:hypothetical protein
VPQCAVEGCAKPATPKKRGWCYAHYMRNYRYGSPTAPKRRQYVDVAGQRFGRLVAVEHEPAPSRFWVCLCDCGATRLAAYEALHKGLATSCGAPDCQRKDEVGYSGVHERLRTRRGPARRHPCVDCGLPARHWSYDRTDPDERHMVIGAKRYPYSMDETRYVPRCVSCHSRFDRGQG